MDVNNFSSSLAIAARNGQLPALAQILIVGIEFIAPILYAWVNWDMSREKSKGHFDDLSNELFDFIVVGSGSAGAVVTNRLSRSHRVLLLEAGGTPHPMLQIPLMTYVLHGIESVDWKWRTVPQKAACFGLKNNISFWPAGKNLGGSSTINGMIYFRGNVQGFDAIANTTGNPDWKMKNLLDIFYSMEDYDGYFDKDPHKHGKGGRLSVEKSHLHPCSIQLLKAAQEKGLKLRDPNAYGPITDGVAPMDFYLKDGRRWTSYDGYLKDIIDRKSLIIRTYATVTKILLDNANRAYGVEYFQDGKRKVAKASKEIILSAGSIQSAKLLMLSGIGPKTELDKFGIPVKSDLPVGQNMQDKYGAFVGPFITSKGKSFLRERDTNIRNVIRWITTGTGPLQCSRSEATYTWSSTFAKKHGYGHTPDLHTYFLAWSIDERYEMDLSNAFNLDRTLLRKHFGKAKGKDAFFQMVSLNKVFGTGTLTLNSANPFASPILDPKYLQHPRDVEVLVEGIRFAVDLVENTTSFAKINAKLFPVPLPGCDQFQFKSDEYYECYARYITMTAYKYSATTPIGKDTSDPKAVVDSELRVFGVKNLRVVDASVLEVHHLSVNHVSIQAMAELASRFILKHWNRISNAPSSFLNLPRFQGSISENGFR